MRWLRQEKHIETKGWVYQGRVQRTAAVQRRRQWTTKNTMPPWALTVGSKGAWRPLSNEKPVGIALSPCPTERPSLWRAGNLFA